MTPELVLLPKETVQGAGRQAPKVPAGAQPALLCVRVPKMEGEGARTRGSPGMKPTWPLIWPPGKMPSVQGQGSAETCSRCECHSYGVGPTLPRDPPSVLSTSPRVSTREEDNITVSLRGHGVTPSRTDQGCPPSDSIGAPSLASVHSSPCVGPLPSPYVLGTTKGFSSLPLG